MRVKTTAGGTQWASYSDLFMVLAFIFLLLYMVAGLRSGMISNSTHSQIREMTGELEEYRSLKTQYLADDSNTRIYDEILGQIHLLENEANENQVRLASEIDEQNQRESSLNKYQKMIVTMIETNAIAKAQAVKQSTLDRQARDKLAEEIEQKTDDVAALEEKLNLEAAQNAALENTLVEKTKDLQGNIQALRRQQDESKGKLAALESQLEGAGNQEMVLRKALYSKTKSFEVHIRDLEGRHDESQTQLTALRRQLVSGAAEKAALLNSGAAEIKKLEGRYAGLRGAYITKQKEVDALADELKTGADRFVHLRRDYSGTLSKAKILSSALGDAKKNLLTTESELARSEEELAHTSDLLENAVTLAKRRQVVANNIMENFRRNGINADVDSKTGDVTLDFGENYFADNSARLVGEMENTLRKAIPVYAKSLFGDEELASQIASVEIIGFASPTYGGKPINPTSLSSADREAINYNLDLSYRRARSIFDYIFDTEKIEFESQSTMLPLIEVTGRSFFSEDIKPGDIGKLSIEEFCGQYNCSKSQRVIIKFGLLDKGEG
jgi:hypothetical protein